MNSRRLILSSLVSLLFIYLIIWIPQFGAYFNSDLSLTGALFGKMRLDLRELWNVIQKIHAGYLIAGFLITAVHVLIRSHRWRIMVKPLGDLKISHGFGIQMIGYMTNMILPLRMGELIKGILLAKRIAVSKSTAIATVLLERTLDFVSLILLTTIIGFLYPFPETIKNGAIYLGIFVVFFLLGLILIGFSDVFNRVTFNLFQRVLPVRLSAKINQIIKNFRIGIGLLKGSLNYPLIVIETVALWIVYAVQVYLIMASFDFFNIYPELHKSPYLACYVVLIMSALALSLPSAPGGVGTFHAGCIFGLALFLVPAEPAAGFALVIHAVSTVFYVVFGIPFMWHEGLQLREIGKLGSGEK